MDFQRGRNGGPACRDNAGYNLWCIGVYGPSLLDTRVLGSGPAGDTLHCPCCCLEALDDPGAKRAFKDLIVHRCNRWWLVCAQPDRLPHNWLFAALALGLIVYGVWHYGRGQIWVVV